MTLKERWSANMAVLFDFKAEKGRLVTKVAVILTTLVANFLYLIVMLQLLKFVFSNELIIKYTFWGWLTGRDVYSQLSTMISSSLLYSFFFAVLLAPLWEEFAFRRYWLKKKLRKIDKEAIEKPELAEKIGKIPIWEVVVFTSIVFGIAHGGPVNLLIQGVSGLLLAYVYLRTGRCFWAAVVYHALFNATLILFAYTGAWKSVVVAITMPYWVLLSF